MGAAEIPVPPLEVQKEIVVYQKVINGAGDLIARTEKKIQATIARVWGEKEKA